MPNTRISWDGGIQVATDGTGAFEPAVDSPPTPLPEKVVVARVIDSVTVSGGRVTSTARTEQVDYQRHRVVVGGKDVTYFRGVQTPLPQYGLVSPLRYGSGLLTLPQIHAGLENAGSGPLYWLRKFARVHIQRVDASGAVVATDFRGFIADFQHTGREFTCILGGEATGLAEIQDRPMPIFPTVSDIGDQVMRTIQDRLRLPIANRPTTGVETMETGGGSQLDFLTGILAMSTERDGVQWTVEPNTSGEYRMQQKDLTTIDATVYIDGMLVSPSLTRDFTEEPNRIWADGVLPDGRRWRPAVYPGLGNGRTVLASTLHPGDSGADVTALIWRLWFVDRLDGDAPSAWTTATDDPVTAAVEQLQTDNNLTVTGNVNTATWNVLFDIDTSGAGLAGSRIIPAAQKSFTQPFLFTASGQIRGKNPDYDRTKPWVDATVNMGPIQGAGQARRWSKRELADPDVSNWVGTITVNTGAVIDGEHNPGDPLASGDVRDARSIKPGHNLWAPTWDGGTLFHVSGVNVTADSVEFAVDTRARDTMKVWEVINRNRESRKTISRNWIAQNRRSGMRDDTGAFYDGGVFGKIERTFCPGNEWTLIPTVGGRSGTLQKIHLDTDTDEALFAFGIFGKQISTARLNNVIGDPTSIKGSKNWTQNQRTLTDDMWMVYAAGTVDTDGTKQLCGFWPESVDPSAVDSAHKTASVVASTDTFTITGHGYSDGHKVYFSAPSCPAGLTPDNSYFVMAATTNTFQVRASTSSTSPMNITADATGVDVVTRSQAYPPITGEYRDHAGAAYFCKGSPILWIAVYPDRDCHVQGGRALELLLDDAAG